RFFPEGQSIDIVASGGNRGAIMAPRKRRRTRAKAFPQYLVARGKGNKVLVGAVFSEIDKKKYAQLVDGLSVSRGITLSTRTFILENEGILFQLFGGIFGPPRPPPPGPSGDVD